jgi:hypothetical protein
MYALNDFKKMIGVETIQLHRGKGRPFAKIGEHQIFVSEKINWDKPLFIMKGEHDAWWVCNSKATFFKEI